MNIDKILRFMMVVGVTVLLHVGIYGMPFSFINLVLLYIVANIIVPELENKKK